MLAKAHRNESPFSLARMQAAASNLSPSCGAGWRSLILVALGLVVGISPCDAQNAVASGNGVLTSRSPQPGGFRSGVVAEPLPISLRPLRPERGGYLPSLGAGLITLRADAKSTTEISALTTARFEQASASRLMLPEPAPRPVTNPFAPGTWDTDRDGLLDPGERAIFRQSTAAWAVECKRLQALQGTPRARPALPETGR